MSVGLEKHAGESFDQHITAHALTTVYEDSNDLAVSDSDDSEVAFSLATDDACTDATISTKPSSRGENGISWAEELVKVFDAKLRAHKDEVQAFLESRCGELSTMMFRESDWRRSNMESSLNACNRRLDQLDTLIQERRNDISMALLSESDRSTRLHGMECKLAQLERRFREMQGASPQVTDTTINTESSMLEKLQEHIEANSEFLRSFIDRESGMISSLSEGLRKTDDKHLVIERKLESVTRVLNDMTKGNSSKSVMDCAFDTSECVDTDSAANLNRGKQSGILGRVGGDTDASSGLFVERRSQRTPLMRTVSASQRPSDLLASRDRIQRLQSAPLLASSGSLTGGQSALVQQAVRSVHCSGSAEGNRSPNACPQDLSNLKKNVTTSSMQTRSLSSIKRRVSPRLEDRRCSK